MALDRQVEQKNPIDEARLPGQLSLLTATVDAPLLIQDPTGAIPRIVEVSPSYLPLDLWDGIHPMGPRRLDQLLEGRISRFFKGSNPDVPCSFAAALE